MNTAGIPEIDFMSISGPFNATGPGDTPSRRMVFACRPAGNADAVPCAKKILTTLARRAYRRPVTEAETERLLTYYQRGRNNGGTFDSGVETALAFMLVNPQFLFRSETDPANAAPGSIHRISDLELASRLSFFLWSSIPDEQLLTLATQGKLKDPAVLEQQVKRMLSDKRSDSLISNFLGQWLYLRNLERHRALTRRSSPISTTTCVRPSSAKPKCSSAASCAKTRASLISSTPITPSSMSASRSTTEFPTSTATSSAK